MAEFEQASKRLKSNSNALDQLKEVTVVVADTGEVSAIQKYGPQGTII